MSIRVDIIPKFSDVKHLSDLAKVFALPMLAVAYMIQTGFTIGWEGSFSFEIHDELTDEQALARLGLIVVGKSLWIAFWGACLYALIAFVHIFINNVCVPLFATIFFVFALLGLFGVELPSIVPDINKFWSYCFLVWGFFLLNIKDQLDENIS